MLVLSVILSSCALNNNPRQISQELAPINGLKTISDMTQIAFEWPSSNDSNIEGFFLYRAGPLKDINDNLELEIVAKIKDCFATHYVDTGLKPGTMYKYELRSYDKEGNISPKGEVVFVNTSPRLDSVSFAQVIGDLPGRVKLLWRPHPDSRVASYIIERNDSDQTSWNEIAKVNGRLNAEYIDADLKPDRQYKYRIFVKTIGGVISNPSEVFYAQTKPLPDPVLGLNASRYLPKKIELKWEKSKNPDVTSYIIYSGTFSYLLTQLGQTEENHYEDFVNSNGTTKYYKVAAVDSDGQIGPKQETAIQGSTLEEPKAPEINGAEYTGSFVSLLWSADPRCVNYKIYKKGPEGEEVIETSFKQYSDMNIKFGNNYYYRVSCSDEFGLDSSKSNQVIVEVK